MEKTDYIERLAAIKDRYGRWKEEDRTELKAMVKELGINHKFRGRCNNCYNDAFHLVMNHLGLKAADLKRETKQSSGKWVYVGNAPAQWYYINGTVTLDENTPDEIVERFVAAFPNQKIYKLNKNTDMDITFISKPNAVHTVVADAGVQPVPAGLTSLQGTGGGDGDIFSNGKVHYEGGGAFTFSLDSSVDLTGDSMTVEVYYDVNNNLELGFTATLYPDSENPYKLVGYDNDDVRDVAMDNAENPDSHGTYSVTEFPASFVETAVPDGEWTYNAD